MKYLSNKNGFLGIDNNVNFKEKVVVVPFGLEKTVSYGGGTKDELYGQWPAYSFKTWYEGMTAKLNI